MAVYNVTRSVDIAVAENTLKRDVDESMLKLEPDAAPLWVLTNNAKKRAPAIAPKFEWFEDAEAPLWGQVSNSTDYSSIATTILVVDSTIFAVDDLIIVPTPTGAGKSAVDEVMLCTGSAGKSITVTRALGGTGTNQTLTSAAGLRILVLQL